MTRASQKMKGGNPMLEFFNRCLPYLDFLVKLVTLLSLLLGIAAKMHGAARGKKVVLLSTNENITSAVIFCKRSLDRRHLRKKRKRTASALLPGKLYNQQLGSRHILKLSSLYGNIKFKAFLHCFFKPFNTKAARLLKYLSCDKWG